MKTALTVLSFLLASAPAFADGFTCQSELDNLAIKVFHETQPTAGTRNAAVLVASDTSVGFGNKTIARFTDAQLTLGNEGTVYTAKVDHRFNDSNRKGELIGGTNIGALKYLVLDVGFSYARPLVEGSLLRGALTLVKRNGEQITIDMECARYLKN